MKLSRLDIRAVITVAAVLVATPWLAGCIGGGVSRDTDWERLEHGTSTHANRVGAIERLWPQTAGDWARHSTVRDAAKDLAWDRDAPEGIRLRVVTLLMSDTGPEADVSNRTFARLMLPTEPSVPVIAEVARATDAGGWTEVSDGLVRSLAARGDDQPIDERIEALVLRRLHGGRDLADVLYGLFLDPTEPEGINTAMDWRGRVRADAWSIIARLDPSGTVARRLIAQPLLPSASDDAKQTVEDLRAVLQDLGALPETPMEFVWLRSLRDGSAENRAWWAAATRAVSMLSPEQRQNLRLRHIEPIRWAAEQRSGWLAADRQALLGELAKRLEDRKQYLRTGDIGRLDRKRSRERLSDWSGTMNWADALAVLVIDDAVAEGGVVGRLRSYIIADRRDKQTEYGGTIEADADGWRLRVFPPRQRDRVGDGSFIASIDMLESSDRALAHFHLQVQTTRNRAYAGPSPGDLAYVQRSGRTGVVMTSVGGDRVNIDYYQPDGVIIDLGAVDLGG